MAEVAHSQPSGLLGQRFTRWLDRRIPPSPRITLSQRNIFIFPTRTGFGFGVLVALLVLVAINYQASLVYGVAFLLGSTFLVTILYTFRNLSGLRLELTSTRSGFVGEDIEFTVRVIRPQGRGREGIQLGWPNGIVQRAEVYEREADTLRLYVQAESRGYLDPGRLLIETYYPLGLLRAWTWVDLEARALVYPKPLFQDFPAVAAGRPDQGELIDPRGSEDFTDIKAYQRGDAVKHIIWRSYARGGELMVKRYASYLEPRLWLDFDAVAGGIEERLSRLTGMALAASRQELEFGLKLGALEVLPSTGELHLERVLRELALYGLR